MTTCNENSTDCPVPLSPEGKIEGCVSFDKLPSFSGKVRLDCYVSYHGDGAIIIECKSTYLKHMLSPGNGQVPLAIEFLQNNWNNFLRDSGLREDVPKPNKIVIYSKNGIGSEKLYEREETTKRLVKRGGAPIKIHDLEVFLYQKNEIKEMNDNLRRLYADQYQL